MWYYGDKPNHINPFKTIRSFDVKVIRGGRKNVSTMKLFMHHVKKYDDILNIPHLIVKYWMPKKYTGLYKTVEHLFTLPSLERNRRYTTIVWKAHL